MNAEALTQTICRIPIEARATFPLITEVGRACFFPQYKVRGRNPILLIRYEKNYNLASIVVA